MLATPTNKEGTEEQFKRVYTDKNTEPPECTKRQILEKVLKPQVK